MRVNDKKELRIKTALELKKMISEARSEIRSMRLNLTQGKLKNTSALTTKRKELAITQTILNEKSQGESQDKSFDKTQDKEVAKNG